VAKAYLERKEISLAVGTRLKSIRQQKGFTQVEIEEQTGISQTEISLFEQGRLRITIENALKLCDLFECSLDFFYGRDTGAAGSPLARLRTAYEQLDPTAQKLLVGFAELCLTTNKAK
jgi:transcriptional regulator with XRE-family HTH domain